MEREREIFLFGVSMLAKVFLTAYTTRDRIDDSELMREFKDRDGDFLDQQLGNHLV